MVMRVSLGMRSVADDFYPKSYPFLIQSDSYARVKLNASQACSRRFGVDNFAARKAVGIRFNEMSKMPY
jgi:hypothetical protein